MEQQEEKIHRFLEIFFHATQVEALYFDRQLNILACHPRGETVEQFQRLSMGAIERFLEELFEAEHTAPGSFYTYYLDQNLVSSISLLYSNGACCGAVVTQPVSLNPLKRADIEARLCDDILCSPGREEYIAAMQGAPVSSHDRVRSTGEVLGLLTRVALEEETCQQVLCGGQNDSTLCRFLQSWNPPKRQSSFHSPKKHRGYLAYYKLKDAISSGDREAVLGALETLDLGDIHLDHQTSKDSTRSLKNSFIEGLAMCCFVAIEAGAPYDRARDLAEEFIAELESTENIADMYQLMKAALLAFTRAVAVTRIVGYSRPVRLTIEYIETRYAEKITLKALAEHTNLSEYYLSTLVKKETGSNIADIINRVRIEASKNILRKSDVSISDLSAMVGYSFSNHFSRVFKQYTGTTPSGYVKLSATASDREFVAKELLNMLSDQLHYYMMIFPGIFDIIRVVDPHTHVAWRLGRAPDIVEDICYTFWGRTQFCKTCTSRMALERNSPCVKLDQGTGHPFLVFAVPLTVGGKRYVLELLKGVTDNYIDCINDPAAPM